MKIYRGEFSDINGKTYRIDFKIPNITDSVIPITLGETPIKVELDGDEEELFKPIRHTSAKIELVSDNYLFDLYSVRDDILVELTSGNGSKKEWIGVVRPLMFNMGYDQTVEEIEIECFDYLSTLDEKYFNDVDMISTRPILTFGEIMHYILHNFTNCKHLCMPDLYSKDFLGEYEISVNNFIDEACKLHTENGVTIVLYEEKNWTLQKILEQMCQYMGLTIVQEGEDVYLIDYLHITMNCNWKVYDLTGNTLGQPELKGCGFSTTDSYMYDNSDLSLLPVYNKYSVKVKTNKVKEFLPDYMDDENLENITYPYTNEPIRAFDRYNEVIVSENFGSGDDDTFYKGQMKFYKSTMDEVKNYMVVQNPVPVSSMSNEQVFYPNNVQSYDQNSENYTVTNNDTLQSHLCSSIIDFRAIEVEGSIYGDEKPHSQYGARDIDDFERYLVIAKGHDINLGAMAENVPVFKIETDDMLFNRDMALLFDLSMLTVPYTKTWTFPTLYVITGLNEPIQYKVNDRFVRAPFPIERDIKAQIDGMEHDGDYEHRALTKMFSYIGIEIKLGDYYYHNVGCYRRPGEQLVNVDYFFRKGFWSKQRRVNDMTSRLYVDTEDDWPFGNFNKICDNSKDEDIQQSDSGFWVMLGANESQGFVTADDTYTIGLDGDEKHETLPEEFKGKLEITIYANPSQSKGCINFMDDYTTGYYFGNQISFLKDFKIKLIYPRDPSMTEDEWKSDTEISAIINEDSMKKAEDIDFEIHSDFGKEVSYGSVVGAEPYSIMQTDSSLEHKAEEWKIYNYTKEYSVIRKMLETSVIGDIKAYSLVTSTKFGTMVVDEYEKNYKTGFTDVKLVEIPTQYDIA